MRGRYFTGASFVLFFTTSMHAASFGEICGSDSDCTDANTECVKFLYCAAGTCQCVSGYGNNNNNGCQKKLRAYGQSCGSDSLCSGDNQKCSGGVCTCNTWYAYHSLARGCVTMTYKVLTETCGGWNQEKCLVQEADGGTCSSVCKCQDGYIMDLTESYTVCRAPRYGESCLHTPSCALSFNSSTVSDDVSSYRPTCNLYVCQCPPSHEHKTVLGYDVCLASVVAGTVLKKTNETCTHFSECESSLCVKCVNTTSGICMTHEQAVTDDNDGGEGVKLDAEYWVVMSAVAFFILHHCLV